MNIIIIDETNNQEHLLIKFLSDRNHEVIIFNTANDGTNYITNNLSDILRQYWTDEFNSDKTADLINYRIDAYLNKTDSIDDVCREIELVIQKTSSNVDIAIERWLGMQENKDSVMIARKSGESYTANQLIEEVRMGTNEGKKLVDSINKLTINLLFRGKEQI